MLWLNSFVIVKILAFRVYVSVNPFYDPDHCKQNLKFINVAFNEISYKHTLGFFLQDNMKLSYLFTSIFTKRAIENISIIISLKMHPLTDHLSQIRSKKPIKYRYTDAIYSPSFFFTTISLKVIYSTEQFH